MAKGIWHDRFNFIMLFVALFFLIPLGIHYQYLILFTSGWLFSTLLFGPDTDIMPKKRTWILGIFLYPYSLFHKHRGISHSLLWGTILRILYSVIIFFIMVYVLNEMGRINLSPEDSANFIKVYIQGFNFQEPQYLLMIWTFIGMWLADLCHLTLDKLS